jgi:tetratricopeptide (TPR) repeat protein
VKSAQNTAVANIYRIEEIEVDPAQRCIRRNGDVLRPRAKSFDLLLYLIERRDRLVSKEELFESLWKNTAVTDNSLVQCVNDVRKALGDDARHARYVKTVAKGGYQFIGPVEETVTAAAVPAAAEPAPQPSPWLRNRLILSAACLVGVAAAYLILTGSFTGLIDSRAVLPETPGKRSVAVLFFENQSRDPELDWMSEGLADMVISNLSRSRDLNVLSRQQTGLLLERAGWRSRQPISLDLAMRLGRSSRADVIALGSFIKAGQKIRVTLQLQDARTGHPMKTETATAERPDFLLDQVDLLAIRLARDIAPSSGASQPQPSVSLSMTNNLEAYRCYSLAVEKMTGLHMPEAFALLERAVALDPEFAMAWARIGYAYSLISGDPAKGKPYLEKAFRLSGKLTEKDRLYIAGYYAIANLDQAGAIRAFRDLTNRFPEEGPAFVRLGFLLLFEGRNEEALAAAQKAIGADPDSPPANNLLGGIYGATHRVEEAIAAFQRYVELSGGDPNAYDSLAETYQSYGRYPEAERTYRRALEADPNFRLVLIHLANLHYSLGRYREALQECQRYIAITPFEGERARGHDCQAWIYLRQGDLVRAEGAAALAPPSGFITSFLVALDRGNLRRSADLLAQLGKITDPGARNRPHLYATGLQQLAEKRVDEALASFQEVLRNPPRLFEWLEDCLGDAYMKLGRLDEAITEYQRVLTTTQSEPIVHYHLAQVYERKGMRREAQAEYEIFAKLWSRADEDAPELKAVTARLRSF